MVTVSATTPGEIWRWIGSPTVGYGGSNFRFGVTILVARDGETAERRIDEGYIITTPSKTLPGENDCFQYEVEGNLELRPKWCTTEILEGRYKVVVEGLGSAYTVDAYCTSNSSCQMLLQMVRNTSYWVSNRNNGKLKQVMTIKSVDYHDSGGTDRTKDQIVFHIEYDEYPTPRVGTRAEVHYSGERSFWMTNTGNNYWNRLGQYTGPRASLRRLFGGFSLPYARESSLYQNLVLYTNWVCDLGDLSQEAAESVRLLNINTAAYAKDLLAIKDMASGLTSLLKPGQTLKDIPKKAAKTYLSYHYGARLTVADTEKVAAAIGRIDTEHITQRVGAHRHVVVDLPGRPDVPVSVDLRLTGVINSMCNEDLTVCESFKRIDRGLYELDLVPSAANIWDAIPFSFVVDWFAPIGASLERKESRDYCATLNVRKAFYSRKFTWAYNFVDDEESTTLQGALKFKIYERLCQDYLVLPSMRVDQPKGISDHWVEGAALLISNI